MAGRTSIIIQGTAWGVRETQNGKRYLSVSVSPGYRDRNGNWKSQPEQYYSVWPAGCDAYQNKKGELAASCNVNASAVAITNVRQKNGGQQGYGAQTGYTQQSQGGFQQSQPPASDPWSSDPSF